MPLVGLNEALKNSLGDLTPKEAFASNVWTFGSVRAISLNISGVPFYLKQKGEKIGKDKKKVPKGAEAWVSLFEDPHPLYDQIQLWRFTSMYYEVMGEVFWLLQTANQKPISSGEIPAIIECVSPAFVRANIIDGVFKGWIYNSEGIKSQDTTKDQELKPYQVIRFFEPSLDGALKSISPAVVAKGSIDIDQNSHEYNKKFFKNGAQISGYLLDENPNSFLPEDEVDKIRTQWDERYAGLRNAHRTPLLSGGLKYVPTGINQKDMDFLNLTKVTREEIIGAYNVPKQQVGIYEDLNYANAKNADRQFWTNNLLPKMRYFMRVINTKMLKNTPYECYFDFDSIEALKISRTESLEGAKGLFDLGYGLNEINEIQELGMATIEEEWANTSVDVRELEREKKESSDGSSSESDAYGNQEAGEERDDKTLSQKPTEATQAPIPKAEPTSTDPIEKACKKEAMGLLQFIQGTSEKTYRAYLRTSKELDLESKSKSEKFSIASFMSNELSLGNVAEFSQKLSSNIMKELSDLVPYTAETRSLLKAFYIEVSDYVKFLEQESFFNTIAQVVGKSNDEIYQAINNRDYLDSEVSLDFLSVKLAEAFKNSFKVGNQ
jgi:HK97 family phage portal protein